MTKLGPTTIWTCPRCSGRLVQAQYQGVDIYLCAGCEGALVPQAKLRFLLSKLARELFSQTDSDLEIASLQDKGGGLVCPLCGKGMEHHGYMGSNQVLVDSCSSCMVLWADPEELGAMAFQFGQTQHHQLQAQRASLQATGAYFKPSEVEKMISKAFLAGVLAGVGGGGILRSWLVVKDLLKKDEERDLYGNEIF